MICSLEPALRNCGYMMIHLTVCHYLQPQLQSPLACLSLLAVAKEETSLILLLTWRAVISLSHIWNQTAHYLLRCSPLWAAAVPCLEKSSCGTHLYCGKSPLLMANRFSYKKESIFPYECGEFTKAFSFTFLTQDRIVRPGNGNNLSWERPQSFVPTNAWTQQ